jgi:hypothetical protein
LVDVAETIVLSRIVVVGELVKSLGGNRPMYKTRITDSNMYYGCKFVIIMIIDNCTMREYNDLYRRGGKRRCGAPA